jgi:hypothetical protein
VNRILESIGLLVATIYFLADAVFMTVARPLANRVAAHWIFGSLRGRIASLRPYPTLALFAVPFEAWQTARRWRCLARYAVRGYVQEVKAFRRLEHVSFQPL